LFGITDNNDGCNAGEEGKNIRTYSGDESAAHSGGGTEPRGSFAFGAGRTENAPPSDRRGEALKCVRAKSFCFFFFRKRRVLLEFNDDMLGRPAMAG
jgi:hypothetical protein